MEWADSNMPVYIIIVREGDHFDKNVLLIIIIIVI